MAWWWSWLLGFSGLFGLWVAGDDRPLGWVFLFFSEILWVIYAIVTRQWGFLPSCLGWGAVFLRNWRKSVDRQTRRGE